DGWYVVQGAVSTDSRITVSGDVKLILGDGCTLNATKGIDVASGSLTIYGQSAQTGALNATATGSNAGIRVPVSSSLTINGGRIAATGSASGIKAAAGIGGNFGEASGSITINNGWITAIGASASYGGAAGIGGGGNSSHATSITITGGHIIAVGGDNGAAGIGGGGHDGELNSYSITGGYIEATGHAAAGTNATKKNANAVGGGAGKSPADLTDCNAVVIDNTAKTATFYGTELNQNMTVPEGYTMTVANGQTLTIPAGVTLTNNGTILIEEGGKLINNDTIINNGTITNNGTYAGTLPMESVRYLDKDGNEQTAACKVITADNISSYGTLSAGWYAVKGTITADSRITVSGDVHLILADGCDFTVSGGIQVQDNSTESTPNTNALTIYAQSTNETTMGKLTANNTEDMNAAIGGGNYGSGGEITINGGTVTATGGLNGAGIGGGFEGSGGTISINGGIVTATSSFCGAGIGGGYYGTGGNITISGGEITAKGGIDGAGIGGGREASGGNITISGGEITAKGGIDGAGIGGGYYGTGVNITISGGEITANGGMNAAGIGGGYYGTGGGIITISGGVISSTGGMCSAGIGSGDYGTGCNITISGGEITANAGAFYGAGIGGGRNGSGGTFQTQKTGMVKGNAIIFASSITDQSGKTDGTWSGVIFEGNDGKVYSSTVTPADDFEIASEKKLLIPEGSTLNITGINAVNNSNVYVAGNLSGTFSGAGSIYYYLTVNGGTASPTYTYSGNTYGKAGETVTLTGTDVPVGQAVSGWTASDSGVTVENNAFTMPAFALTLTAQYIDAPVLSGFSITQGETPNSYTVKFTSDQTGTWYYTIDRKGTADTSDFTSWISGSCLAGENTIILTDQIAGEKIHLAVVNQYGLCSTVTDNVKNEHTALFNGLFAMSATLIVDTIYQHDAPSKEALEALLTERINEYINSVLDYDNYSEEELEVLRTLTTQMIVKQYVPAIAATADTVGVNGSYIFEMEGSLSGWSTVSYFDDSDYRELNPTVIAESYYTVTLDADGGTVNSGNVTGYVYGVGATLPTDMTRWGYGFDGWYDDETGEKVTTISNTDWGNRSFTVHWALGGTAPTYTVTIPATVELGGTVTVSAEGVSIVEGSRLVVTLSGTSGVENAFTLSNGGTDTVTYQVTKDSKDGTVIHVDEAVLTVAGGTDNNSGSVTLYFTPASVPKYAGKYTGTVTFTVSLEEVPEP
ncbi:MAG: beta strand repeat-containing protein, partial [Eubacteriales bacterium]